MTNLQFSEKELLAFIAKAHLRTYAAEKKVKQAHRLETPFLPGLKCFYYEDGDWEYFDGYSGSQWAPGSELILFQGEPVWRMSYQGQPFPPLTDKFYQETAFPFLKRALRKASEDRPFRGLDGYTEGDLKYEFEFEGNNQYFTGTEYICLNGSPVFRQDVMGSVSK